MNGPFKRLDDHHEDIVRQSVHDLIDFLDKDIPRSKDYSHINMSINVLTGGLVTLAHNFIAEEDEDRFIKNMALTLKANFDANRKNKRRP